MYSGDAYCYTDTNGNSNTNGDSNA
jgi:hypothetical protein